MLDAVDLYFTCSVYPRRMLSTNICYYSVSVSFLFHRNGNASSQGHMIPQGTECYDSKDVAKI